MKVIKGVKIADNAGIREALEGLPAELVRTAASSRSAGGTSSGLLLAESGREFPVSGQMVTLGRDRHQDIDLTPYGGVRL